jgi:hypothetical protein
MNGIEERFTHKDPQPRETLHLLYPHLLRSRHYRTRLIPGLRQLRPVHSISPTAYQRQLLLFFSWRGSYEDVFVYKENAGVGFEVYTRDFLHDFEPFDCYVCLI